MQKQTDTLIQRLKQQPRHGRQQNPANDMEGKKINLQNELKTAADAVPKLKSLWTAYSSTIEGVVNEHTALAMGLNNVLAIQDKFAQGVIKLTQNLTLLENRFKDVTQGYGLSIQKADAFSKKLRQVAIDSKVGEETMNAYALQLKDLSSGFLANDKSFDKFGKKLLRGQQYMQNNLKITEEAAQGYEYYATSVAKSGIEALAIQNEMADAIGKATGLDGLQVQKQLTEDIGGLTANLQLQYSRIPGSLELAVLKSKMLGMNMETLNNAGENLLNIESSIGQEMEYQLLSGKRLLTQDGKSLTNAYRMATIQGDANKQAELMNHLIKTQGPVLEKNLYARKKAAELMGTDEATLARSIQKQKIISELGAERLMELKEGNLNEVAKSLREKGVSDEKINELIQASDTRTTEEIRTDLTRQIASNTAKMAEINLADTRTATLKAGEQFESFLKQFDGNKGFKKSVGSLSTFSETTRTVADGLTTITSMIPLLGDKITGWINDIKALLPETPTVQATKADTKKDDAIIMNDGVIRFHQDDKFMRVNDSTMIAGTNVNGNRQLARAINGGGSIDYGKMAQAIAMALQNVKVEAKVTQDMLFAATKMNDRRRF